MVKIFFYTVAAQCATTVDAILSAIAYGILDDIVDAYVDDIADYC